jgi:hypothetical protein
MFVWTFHCYLSSLGTDLSGWGVTQVETGWFRSGFILPGLYIRPLWALQIDTELLLYNLTREQHGDDRAKGLGRRSVGEGGECDVGTADDADVHFEDTGGFYMMGLNSRSLCHQSRY